MRVLVFSDVHGNLPAFEKMLNQEEDIDLYISLGDVVNYGPWSNECVDLLESIPAIRLVGNHETYFMKGSYPGKSELVKNFFITCFLKFDRHQSISEYSQSYNLGGYLFQHTLNNAYLYPDSEIDAMGNHFIGHSHYQFDRQSEDYHVINVGSVGQNRKEIDVIDYAVYDDEKQFIQLKNLKYDLQPLIDKMKELNYPQECIDYYVNKPKQN